MTTPEQLNPNVTVYETYIHGTFANQGYYHSINVRTQVQNAFTRVTAIVNNLKNKLIEKRKRRSWIQTSYSWTGRIVSVIPGNQFPYHKHKQSQKHFRWSQHVREFGRTIDSFTQ